MNSGLKKLPIIGLAGFILIGLAIGSKPTPDASRINPAPSFKKNDVPETKYSFSFADKPKSLMDSIQEMANKLGKRIYEYQVEIEIIPENQIYQISNSGYQQYEVTRKGVGYSHTWVKFYTDKKMPLSLQRNIQKNVYPLYLLPRLNQNSIIITKTWTNIYQTQKTR